MIGLIITPMEMHLSTGRPPMPKDAEVGVRIDFRKGEANPQRVFQATVAMINALQRLDRALCGSIDVSIEPLMVLEEIEAGSLVVWLKNVLCRLGGPCASGTRLEP